MCKVRVNVPEGTSVGLRPPLLPYEGDHTTSNHILSITRYFNFTSFASPHFQHDVITPSHLHIEQAMNPRVRYLTPPFTLPLNPRTN